MKRFAIKIVAAWAMLMGASAAFSHVTLADQAAAAGASYRGVLKVGHGCAGAATTSITVSMPSGFNGAQPLVKAGWTVSTQVGKLDQPYVAHGTTYTEGVQGITWTAKGAENALPDAFADEFVFRGTTPKKPGTLWFKVVQGCVTGQNAWVEIPAPGKDAHSLKSPAARLDVLDVQAAGDHAH
ncbi:YcnI family protein [Rhodoferax sp.]|uniref:YcnI family copper-binding membrane protein n=1 Tax=Rhodoferax sp. TaxID=50421 RepID=UPI0025E44517|nr:YcnI family protein [Rhodoferax sp.]